MTDYRCPKHDRIFETYTDQRKPGALESSDSKMAAHPVDGHPDCPKCQEEAKAPKPSQQAPQQPGAVAQPTGMTGTTRRIG